ncbi:hypothetical protein [Streptomyces sp. NPDC051561]|uniref:hypothetical protein n=1 Tax=Streptomyces sp. NPDC051561 TaxID=3365658 RepID=UPI00379CC0F4
MSSSMGEPILMGELISMGELIGGFIAPSKAADRSGGMPEPESCGDPVRERDAR